MNAVPADEPVVWSGQPAWSSYILLWIFAVVFAVRAVAFAGLGRWESAGFQVVVIAFLSAIAWFLRRTTRYRITRRAIYRTQGILGKTEQSFSIESVSKVSKQQGPLERLFGSGTVMIHLKSGVRERLSGVKDPDVVCSKITALL